MANSAQEKTEQPTPKKKRDARKKGEVAKSMEVNTALLLFGGAIMLLFTGPALIKLMEDLCIEVFGNANSYEAASFGQVGIRVAEEAMKPKWDKLNPINGFKNMFSMKALFELVKGLFKMTLVLTIAFLVLRGHQDEFLLASHQGAPGIINLVGSVAMEVFLKIAVALMFLAAVDYLWQRYQFNKKLKMTKQEVKEEHKQTEGDPLIKSRIRSLQEDMARKRMMQEVPEADVVITNPTHYAVALSYKDEDMQAPTVVAKGMRKIAERIKALAAENDVPVIENPPLARSLYSSVETGQEIPANFYRAIAEILAQVYKMRK